MYHVDIYKQWHGRLESSEDECGMKEEHTPYFVHSFFFWEKGILLIRLCKNIRNIILYLHHVHKQANCIGLGKT